jgi:FdhD protein
VVSQQIMSRDPASRASPAHDEDESSCAVRLTRVAEGETQDCDDLVATEEPLEIQVGAATLAVVMRTPGDDEDLALGLLLNERIVASAADVASVRHCSLAATAEADGNVVRVRLKRGVKIDLRAVRRNLYASSSCGLCGKAAVDAAMSTAPPLDDASAFAAAFFEALPAKLRRSQDVFDRTGGLHAAALFDAAGALLVAREDVGRHNAVDKIVGWAARAGRLPLAGHVLAVSGRISYEIVQKALAARIPVIAAVSAPTSLAVALAESARLTLVGFLRDRRFNVYGERRRVRP